MSGGGADIAPVEYLADLYLNSGRNIARVTAPGRLLSFHGGHAIVRDLRDILWALQQADLVIQPTARYWELLPVWIRELKDPDHGGREAYQVLAAVALPDGWHIGLPPDYALYHDRDTAPVPYGWEPEPPPAPSTAEARCTNPGCDTLLTVLQLKAERIYCSVACQNENARTETPPPLASQACLWCGEMFTPRWQRPYAGQEPRLTRYCGRPCAQKAMGNAKRVNAAHTAETKAEQRVRLSTAEPTPCAHCGGLFKPYRSRTGYTKYCSRACSSAANLPKLRAGLDASRGDTVPSP